MRNVRVLFSPYLNIGIDEVVQRLALLRGVKFQVTPGRELYAVGIMRSEVIVLFRLMVPSLRDIHRDPSVLRIEEFRPTMVTSNIGRRFVRRHLKSNLETRRNALRSRHRNEERVKISAVALLRVARIKDVASPPTRAGLVVAHVRKHVVVNSSSFVELRGFVRRDFGR